MVITNNLPVFATDPNLQTMIEAGWSFHLDTHEIAKRLGIKEAEVYNFLAHLREHKRKSA